MSSRLSRALLLAVIAFSLTGQSCGRAGNLTTPASGAITVWGLWQESSHMSAVLKAFEDQTGVRVTYKKAASVAGYERDLIEALAEGRGPDVFVIHHTWVDDKREILSPAPAAIVDQRAVREEFVDVVEADVVRDGFVYALPTSVDTLAMYYNKDLFNSAGIAQPPRTWTDFQRTIERLTTVNRLGVIQQSGAALGTAANINRAPDIMQLLMLQSGLKIIDPAAQNRSDVANETGERAATFYTDFANRAKQTYTWNLQQDYSIDAFSEGDTAVMFNYSYHVPTIRAKNPRLNFGIAPMPQIAGSSTSSEKDFAAYWPFAVSKSSPNTNAAWTFVRYLTTKEPAATLNQAQQVPPARRDSITDIERDPILGVFAEQALTAVTWPRVDIAATDAIFNAMIDDVVTGQTTTAESLRRAKDQLEKLYADKQS